MTPEFNEQRTLQKNHDLDEFVAELTEAAYPVALRHKESKEWLDLELDLWKVLGQTVKKWEHRAHQSLSK